MIQENLSSAPFMYNKKFTLWVKKHGQRPKNQLQFTSGVKKRGLEVQVTSRTRRLENEYREYARAVKSYGTEVARKYIQRINIIKQMRNIEELMRLPGLGCHPLKGDRHRQYAVKLTGFSRLIFTLKDDALEIAHIEEVSKHYGD